MVDKMVMKQRLESVVRVLEAGHDMLAKQMVLGIIDQIDIEVEEFEKELDELFERE